MKKIITFLIIVALAVFYFIFKKDTIEDEVVVLPTDSITLCFYKEFETESGLFDRAWLRMELVEEKVSGEYRNLPAEKDSKIGTFEGVVGPVDQYAMARTADLWWEAKAEGTTVLEQLRVVFGEGTASVGFAEMVDRGDGVYVYQDENNITYWQELHDVSCEDLSEQFLVEDYVKANIKTLVQEAPVLGGSWYVVSIDTDTTQNTGTVVYEDGHIQGTATFEYEVVDNTMMSLSLRTIE